jgi:chitinase
LYTSVATGANPDFAAHTELGKVARAVDSVNLMSYDYYEPTDDKIAGHHAPLFANPADPKQVSVDASVKMYLANGVPAKKLVLGVPFYGHAWTTAGLYQAGTGIEVPADLTGFVRQWDSVSSAPYLYNSTSHVFISLDDPESLALKSAYVKKHKLGGVMFWDYESDVDGKLLNTLYTTLSGH